MYKRLHDTLNTSVRLGKVSDFAHRCWTVGLSQSDTFGRLTADPEKFRMICFANRPSVTVEQIMVALDELAEVDGEGLVHLYVDAEGERYLVFHKHEPSNPSSGFKYKTSKWPAPPRGLCPCVKYTPKEAGQPVGGREFRFEVQAMLFPSANCKEGGKQQPGCSLFQEEQPVSYRDVGLRQTETDQDRSLQPHAPAHSLSLGEGAGGGDAAAPTPAPVPPCRAVPHAEVPGGSAWEARPKTAEDLALNRLCDEFTNLTGRMPLTGATNVLEVTDLLRGFIRRRGLEALIEVMRRKTSDCVNRHGRSPSSMQYFVPIFEDDRAFAPVQAPTVKAPTGTGRVMPHGSPLDDQTKENVAAIRKAFMEAPGLYKPGDFNKASRGAAKKGAVPPAGS